jgi:ribosomal protein S18 acetylase RimI-like enzyme
MSEPTDVIIRTVFKKDVDQVLIMIKELASLEGGDCLFTKKHFLASAFGKDKCFGMLVAMYKKRYAGYITFHPGYDIQSASKGTYLIDLYIRKQFRKNKIATLLMSAASGIARQQEGKWISWHVKPANAEAIAFYRSLGSKKINASQYYLEI